MTSAPLYQRRVYARGLADDGRTGAYQQSEKQPERPKSGFLFLRSGEEVKARTWKYDRIVLLLQKSEKFKLDGCSAESC